MQQYNNKGLNKMKKLIFAVLVLLAVVLPLPTFAQTTGIDVAFTRPVADQDAITGDIVEPGNGGLIRSRTAYSTKIYGVLQENSLFIYRKIATDSSKPITRNGIVSVNVTTLTGDIKIGDYITSSPIPGKGQKANRPGYVLGVAMENFKTQGTKTINFEGASYPEGSILVALKPEFAGGVASGSTSRLIDQLGSQLFQNINDSEGFNRLIRYFIAGIVILIAFIVGFVTFARSIPKSIEAIGRNPLARSQIQFTIMLNIALTVVSALIGIAGAFIILKF